MLSANVIIYINKRFKQTIVEVFRKKSHLSLTNFYLAKYLTFYDMIDWMIETLNEGVPIFWGNIINRNNKKYRNK